MTRGPAQAGNRASRTGRYLQWWDTGPECNAVTPAVCKVRDSTLIQIADLAARRPARRYQQPPAPMTVWPASGASPQGRGFEPHSCHFRWQCPRPPRRAYATTRTARHRRRNCLGRSPHGNCKNDQQNATLTHGEIAWAMIAARVPNRGPRPRGQARTAAPSTLDTNTRDQAILCKKILGFAGEKCRRRAAGRGSDLA